MESPAIIFSSHHKSINTNCDMHFLSIWQPNRNERVYQHSQLIQIAGNIFLIAFLLLTQVMHVNQFHISFTTYYACNNRMKSATNLTAFCFPSSTIEWEWSVCVCAWRFTRSSISFFFEKIEVVHLEQRCRKMDTCRDEWPPSCLCSWSMKMMRSKNAY